MTCWICVDRPDRLPEGEYLAIVFFDSDKTTSTDSLVAVSDPHAN
jgi:hypothetical protein